MSVPKVYIVVLNYNNWQDTIECCESLLHLAYSNYYVVVCDNNSTDNSSEKLSEWEKEYKNDSFSFIYNDHNLGYAGGNNIGIKYAMTFADCSYVWLLNNDTVVDKDSLQELVNKFDSDSTIGLCGSLLYYYYQQDKIQAISGRYDPIFATSYYNTNFDINNVKGISYPVGASMMASRKFIEDIGLLSEEYFLYYEELDWVMRAKNRYNIGYAFKSIVYHKEGASIGSKHNPIERSELSDFYILRNRITVTKKFFAQYLPTVYLGLVIALLNRLKRNQCDRAKMILCIMKKGPISYTQYKERCK